MNFVDFSCVILWVLNALILLVVESLHLKKIFWKLEYSVKNVIFEGIFIFLKNLNAEKIFFLTFLLVVDFLKLL